MPMELAARVNACAFGAMYGAKKKVGQAGRPFSACVHGSESVDSL